MSTKAEELRKLNAEKKALSEKQKTLRDELNATKGQRKESRATRAACRKEAREIKGRLRDLSASILPTLKGGDVETMEELADNISEASADLASAVRKFAEASKDPVDVDSDDEAGEDELEGTEGD